MFPSSPESLQMLFLQVEGLLLWTSEIHSKISLFFSKNALKDIEKTSKQSVVFTPFCFVLLKYLLINIIFILKMYCGSSI